MKNYTNLEWNPYYKVYRSYGCRIAMNYKIKCPNSLLAPLNCAIIGSNIWYELYEIIVKLVASGGSNCESDTRIQNFAITYV